MASPSEASPLDSTAQRVIYVLSGVVCVAVAFLILGPRPEGMAGSVDVSWLPTVNASLNSLTTVLLLSAFVAIKMGQVAIHRWLMTSALGTSAMFLVTYVVYHWFKVGPAEYHGDWRGLYLTILLTHIVLAALILPLALTTWFRGWSGAFARHKRIAPATLGLWLYVSVTGVLIYWMVHV